MSFKTVATKAVAKAIRACAKHAPTIMFVSGCVGVAVATVEACKGSTTIKEDMAAPVKELKDAVAQKDNIDIPKKDFYRQVLGAAWDVVEMAAKHYGIAVALDILSYFLLIKSHGQLSRKNKELSAGIIGISSMFANYRKNVIDDLGKDADLKYRLGAKTETVEEPVLDKNGNPKADKNGEVKMAKKKIDILPENYVDDVNTALWDEVNAWKTFDTSSDPIVRHEMNLDFILRIQEWATQTMKLRYTKAGGPGYILINEVREKLGLKPIDVGWMFGWLYDPFCSDYDNEVNFGLLDPDDAKRAFLRGDEEAVILTFNHDGYILDKAFPQTKLGREFMRRLANEG